MEEAIARIEIGGGGAHRQCRIAQRSHDLRGGDGGIRLQHQCRNAGRMRGRSGGAEEIRVAGIVLAFADGRVQQSIGSGRAVVGQGDPEEGVVHAVRSHEVRLLADYRCCQPVAVDVEQDGCTALRGIRLQGRRRGSASRCREIECRAHRGRSGGARMTLQRRAVGREGIDGAAQTVILDGHDDPAGHLRAEGVGGQTNDDVHRLLAAVPGGICRVGDDQDLVRIDPDGVGTRATDRVVVIVGDDHAVGRACDAQVDAAARPGTGGVRAGHVGLIPLHDDCDEIARRNRRYGHGQSGRIGGAGDVKIQQKLARVRSAGRLRGEARCGVRVGQGTVVAGGGEIGDSLGLHAIDGLGNYSVLEERLVEINDVVGDHLGTGGRQLADAVGKVSLAVLRGIEGETRARRNVVNDLQHRPPLVAERQLGRRTVVEAGRLFEHIDARRQIARLHVRGVVGGESVVRVTLVARDRHAAAGSCVHGIAIEAVGQDADGDAGAVQRRIVRAYHVAALGEITL